MSKKNIFSLAMVGILIVLGLLFSDTLNLAQAQSTSSTPSSTPTRAEQKTFQNGVAWTNPEGSLADDGDIPAKAIGLDQSTNYLEARGLNIHLPSNTSSVNGIQVCFERKGDGTRYGGAFPRNIRLIKPDGTYSAYNFGSGSRVSSVRLISCYGGPTDTWGETWTRDQINNSNFGVMSQYDLDEGRDAGVPGSIEIYKTEVKVWYTTGGSIVTPGPTPSMSEGDVELTGWAWSSNIGWISFNKSNTGASSDFKVFKRASDGALEGYAWSSNIGWIRFNPDFVGPQSPTYGAKVEGNSLNGWARACSVFSDGVCGTTNPTGLKSDTERGGWDGWIKMHNVEYNPTTGSYGSSDPNKGFAWGHLNLGWIKLGLFGDADPEEPCDPTLQVCDGGCTGPDCTNTSRRLTVEKLNSCGGAVGQVTLTPGANGSGSFNCVSSEVSCSLDYLRTVDQVELSSTNVKSWNTVPVANPNDPYLVTLQDSPVTVVADFGDCGNVTALEITEGRGDPNSKITQVVDPSYPWSSRPRLKVQLIGAQAVGNVTLAFDDGDMPSVGSNPTVRFYADRNATDYIESCNLSGGPCSISASALNSGVWMSLYFESRNPASNGLSQFNSPDEGWPVKIDAEFASGETTKTATGDFILYYSDSNTQSQ